MDDDLWASFKNVLVELQACAGPLAAGHRSPPPSLSPESHAKARIGAGDEVWPLGSVMG